MTSPAPRYHGYRFPPESMSHAVWLSQREGLSVRAVDVILAERGSTVSDEAIRQGCQAVEPDDVLVLMYLTPRRQVHKHQKYHPDAWGC